MKITEYYDGHGSFYRSARVTKTLAEWIELLGHTHPDSAGGHRLRMIRKAARNGVAKTGRTTYRVVP